MSNKIKPFLRWAGGKKWLTKTIKDYLPLEFNNYHEPFLGSGSIYIFLLESNLIKNKAFLSDSNDELINAFCVIRDNVDELITILKDYKNEKEFFYWIREKKFDDKINNAARFIFLNKASYNGIYRVNSKGKYNVPYGYRKSNNLFEFENIQELSRRINDQSFFRTDDFDSVKNYIKKNDLVFLDPPYVVSHNDNGFIEYNQSIFKWNDQERLADLLEYILSKNANFILTNAAHERIDKLFSPFGQKHIVKRFSKIGGKGSERKNINEYIFTSVKK
jgi:DNA adenine methylase